jgi:hypothetical protein
VQHDDELIAGRHTPDPARLFHLLAHGCPEFPRDRKSTDGSHSREYLANAYFVVELFKFDSTRVE